MAIGKSISKNVAIETEEEQRVIGGEQQGYILGPTLWNILYDGLTYYLIFIRPNSLAKYLEG